jgi:hypothetical protein
VQQNNGQVGDGRSGYAEYISQLHPAQTERALIKGSTFVFGPLIKQLQARGYTRENLRACAYDWRLPPEMLEERDKYFSCVGFIPEPNDVVHPQFVTFTSC